MSSSVDFVLDAFNTSSTLDVAGTIPASLPVQPVSTYTCKLDVQTSDVRNIFQFQTDATDITDLEGSDLTYHFNVNAIYDLTNGTAGVALNPADALMTAGASQGHAGDASKTLVQHDFVRKLCKHYFNTEYMVDNLSNEEAVRQEIHNRGAADFMENLVTKVYNANGQTNEWDGSGNPDNNLGKRVMEQIAWSNSIRLIASGADDTISDTSGNQPIPFIDGDKIVCSWTLTENSEQKNTRGFLADEMSSVLYRVELTLVSDGAQVNYTDL